MTGSSDVYKSNVHLFGATSSPFCANFALRKTASEFGSSMSPFTTLAVNECFYVDDCLLSCASVSETKGIVDELRQLLARGGFHLNKWISTIPGVLDSIRDSVCVGKHIYLDLRSHNFQRALGILWDVDNDCLKFKLTLPTRPPNRRGILSTVASLYDPLGFVAPLLLPAGKLLQDQCHHDDGWDVAVDAATSFKWNKWLINIQSSEQLSIQRCFISKPEATFQSHVFSDASTVGYGAAAYIRTEVSSGRYTSNLLLGKSRVTRKKFSTVPRLELTAAVLAVKLMSCLLSELKLEFGKLLLWSDTTIVLHCIKNTKSRFVTFVANRLRQIHEASEPSQWRYVPSSLNPADLASRGLTSAISDEMKTLLEGPHFLLKHESEWPENVVSATETKDSIENQLLSEVQESMFIELNSIVSLPVMDKLFSYYSSWFKLKRAVAWLKRFILFYRVMSSKLDSSIPSGNISVSELNLAGNTIVRLVQSEYFGHELDSMNRKPDTGVSNSSCLLKLSPIIIYEILRVGGRLNICPVDYASRHPSIMPNHHHVTDLIIRYCHETNGYVGVAQTLATTRENFWIIRRAAAVKRVLNRCLICRSRFPKVTQQIMADLPETRVSPGDFPCASVGLDYFGPILVKQNRNTGKGYGCLFSCMKTRAVHIEIVSDLTTYAFLLV